MSAWIVLTATTPADAESLIQYLPIIGGIVIAAIPASVALWNRRRGAVESKQPTFTEVWAENRAVTEERDQERRMRRFFEDRFHTFGRALISLTARHPAHTDEQRAVDQYRHYLESKETP